jgi:hypothetical protein
VHTRLLSLVALGGLSALSACTSGQSAIVPPSTAVNLAATAKLQFAVGTANIAGTPGLNTVVTFRQPNGLSATLVNTPTITGPATFAVPGSGLDTGTNTISGSPQVAAGLASIKTTFGQSGGAFAYGFAPLNISQNSPANFGAYCLPFYALPPGTPVCPSNQVQYIIGPGNTYVSNFRDGTQAPGFGGYASGFTDFAAAPVAGTYTLGVKIPLAIGSVPDFTAAATLGTTVPLPLFAPPVYTTDGAGGGTVALTVPAGVTEALVYVLDGTTGNFYTLLTRTTGPQTLTLPSNIGPIVKGVAGPSIPLKDPVQVYAVGFNYPAIEASPIGKGPAQTPVITGANGQADITTSDPSDPTSNTFE